jgi:1-deoxy-D-xylulose-5-phosphate synthase
MVPACALLAERLDATLVNMRFIKPLDETAILELAARHEAMVTVEENVVAGGGGSAIDELLAAHARAIPVLNIGIPDEFIEHGSREDCLVAARLDPHSLETTISQWWRVTKMPAAVRSR